VDGNGGGTATCDLGTFEFFPIVNDRVTLDVAPITVFVVTGVAIIPARLPTMLAPVEPKRIRPPGPVSVHRYGDCFSPMRMRASYQRARSRCGGRAVWVIGSGAYFEK